MKNKKLTIGAAALTAVIATTGFAASSLAYQGDYTKSGPNCTLERHEIMEAAFENNDYNAWQEQMAGRGRVTQVVNENNFSKFAEAHRLGQAGDKDGADAVRAELGLRTSNGERMGAGYRGGNSQGQGSGQGRGMR